MYAIYINNFINDSTKNCGDYIYDFNRMCNQDIKDIFEKVWNIGKVSDIDIITTQYNDTSIPYSYGAIVYIESKDLYNGSSSIIDLLEYDEMVDSAESAKHKFYLHGDQLENGSGLYLEVELCTSDMLYAMSSK